MEPWAFWEPCEHDRGEAVLGRLAVARPEYFAGSRLIGCRWSPLSFYRYHRLVELRFANGQGTQRVLVLEGPEQSAWLDGSSAPIHDANEAEDLTLTDRTAANYLRFFCYFVCGDEGAFVLVEAREDIQLAEAVGVTAGDLEPSLDTARDKAHLTMVPGVDSDARWVFDAAVAYGDAFFAAAFALVPSGLVEMIDDEPIGTLHTLVVSRPPKLFPPILDPPISPSSLEDLDDTIADPERRAAHRNSLGDLLRQQGDMQKALDHYRAAVELAPDNSGYLRDLVATLIHLDRVELAVTLADTIADRAHQAAFRNNLANLLREHDVRTQDALAQHRVALRLVPDNPVYLHDLTKALLEADRIGDALALADTVSDPERQAAQRNSIGDRLRVLNRTDEALTQYQAAMRLAPHNPVYGHDVTKILLALDRVGEAIVSADTIADAAARGVQHSIIGTSLRGQNRAEEALARYRAAAGIVPGDPTYIGQITETLLKLNRVGEAIALGDTLTDTATRAAHRKGLRIGLREIAQIDWD